MLQNRKPCVFGSFRNPKWPPVARGQKGFKTSLFTLRNLSPKRIDTNYNMRASESEHFQLQAMKLKPAKQVS
jgi:hypothetical protein